MEHLQTPTCHSPQLSYPYPWEFKSLPSSSPTTPQKPPCIHPKASHFARARTPCNSEVCALLGGSSCMRMRVRSPHLHPLRLRSNTKVLDSHRWLVA